MSPFSLATVFFFTAFVSATLEPGMGSCYGSGNPDTNGFEVDTCTPGGDTAACYVGLPGMTGWSLGSEDQCKDSDGNNLGCCNGVCGAPCPEGGVCYGSGWGEDDGEESVSCDLGDGTIGCYVGLPGMEGTWTLGVDVMCRDSDGEFLGCCMGVCGEACEDDTMEAPSGSGVCYGSGWGDDDGEEAYSCAVDSDTIGCYVGAPGMTGWTLGVEEMCRDADGNPLDCCDGVCGQACATPEPTSEPTVDPTSEPTLAPTNTLYSNLGWGKCLTSDGQDPSFEFHSGKSESACKTLCNNKANCGGYSRSYYSNCLLWMTDGLIGGGASWGGAKCKRKLGLAGVVQYANLGFGKCLTSDGQDPQFEYHSNTSWWKCMAKCNADSSCGGFSRSNFNNCLIWKNTALIGGGASWGGAKCHRKL